MTAQNIAFSEVARQAILRDPDFRRGDYYETGRAPRNGLSVARMTGHITYLSEESMQQRFGRRLQHGGSEPHGGLDIDFAVESYLHHQGDSFAERFDANTYLYYTRVLDVFDPFPDERAPVPALAGCTTRFLVLSFSSDWRFGTPHSRAHRARAAAERRARDACTRSRRPTATTRSCSTCPSTSPRVQAFVERAQPG